MIAVVASLWTCAALTIPSAPPPTSQPAPWTSQPTALATRPDLTASQRAPSSQPASGRSADAPPAVTLTEGVISNAHAGLVMAVKFLDDGRLVSIGRDGIRCWNRDGSPAAADRLKADVIWGALAATAPVAGVLERNVGLRVVQLPSMQTLQTIDYGPEEKLTPEVLALSGDGRRIGLVQYDQLRIWCVGTGELMADFKLDRPSNALVLSRDGALAAADMDMAVGLFDVNAATKTRTFDWLHGQTLGIQSAAFAPDRPIVAGGRFALGPKACQTMPVVQLFSVDGEDGAQLFAPSAAILAVCFDQTGRYLVASGVPEHIWLWDVEQRRLLGWWDLEELNTGGVFCLALDAERGIVSAGTANGQIVYRAMKSSWRSEAASETK